VRFAENAAGSLDIPRLSGPDVADPFACPSAQRKSRLLKQAGGIRADVVTAKAPDREP
jgi:hypothetical protein